MTPSFVRRIGLATAVICEHLSKLLQRRRAVQSHVRQGRDLLEESNPTGSRPRDLIGLCEYKVTVTSEQ